MSECIMNIYCTLLLILVSAGFGNICNEVFHINLKIYIVQIIEKIKVLIDNISPFLIKVGYNTIYYYSVVQIQFNKLKNIISPKLFHIKNEVYNYLKKNNWIEELPNKNLILIDKDSNIIKNIFIKNENNLKTIFEKNSVDQDMIKQIEFLDKNWTSGFTNHIFYERIPLLLDYQISNIGLLSVILQHNNKSFPITLNNGYNNYYIVNNSLNQNFFKYYIKNILNADIDNEEFDYTVSIIDHNAEFITLLPNQKLIFGLNDYQIITEDRKNKVEVENITEREKTPEETVNYDDNAINSDSEKSDDFVKLDSNN